MLRSGSTKDNICLAYLSAMRGFRSRGIGGGIIYRPDSRPQPRDSPPLVAVV